MVKSLSPVHRCFCESESPVCFLCSASWDITDTLSIRTSCCCTYCSQISLVCPPRKLLTSSSSCFSSSSLSLHSSHICSCFLRYKLLFLSSSLNQHRKSSSQPITVHLCPTGTRKSSVSPTPEMKPPRGRGFLKRRRPAALSLYKIHK